MPDCPHCSVAITHLSGFTSEEDVKARLSRQAASLGEESKALKTEITNLRTKTEGHDAIVAERDTLKSAATAREQKDARVGLLTADGAKVDPALLDSFEMVYNASQAGKAEADQATFEAWFAAEAAEHVLLSPHFGKGTAAAAAGNNGADAGATNLAAGLAAVGSSGNAENPAAGSGVTTLAANVGATATPGGPGGKITPQDAAAHFNSPAFLKLDRPAQRAEIARVQSIVEAQENTPPA